MKLIPIFLLSALFLSSHHSFAETCRLGKGKPSRDWVFFDLGNTLIDTTKGPRQFDYMPGALAYLKKLKASGYRLGLISNIPVSWGKSFNERLKRLKQEIKTNLKPRTKDFNWSQFELIFLPENEKEYKPNPIMFEKAFKQSKTKNNQVFFQGEDLAEVEMAEKIGLNGHSIKVLNRMTTYLPCLPKP